MIGKLKTWTLLAALASPWACGTTRAATQVGDAGSPLLRQGTAVQTARLVGLAADEAWEFVSADGTRLAPAPTASLVRFGSTQATPLAAAAVLRCGSAIALAPSWTGAAPIVLAPASDALIRLQTRSWGAIEVDRRQLAGVLWQLPPSLPRQWQRSRTLRQLAIEPTDTVELTGGDRLRGRVLSVAATASEAPQVSLESPLGRLDLPLSQVRSLSLGLNGQPAKPSTGLGEFPRPKLWAGLRDGSNLAAQTFRDAGDGIVFTLSSGLELPATPIDQIVSLVAGPSTLRRVGETDILAYRHEPTLALARDYRLDGNVAGGPMVVAGNLYRHGIGVPTTSELTVAVPSDAREFAAEVAVDDAAGEGGSVRFSVAVHEEGDLWREACRSPVVRGGDAPATLRTTLKDVAKIRLRAASAERGDELDWANWLNPRFE